MRGAALALVVATAVACQAKKSKDEAPPAVAEPAVEKVDERWQQVIAWAEPAVEAGDTAQYDRAIELAKDHTKAIRDAKRSAERYAVEQGALPPAAGEAVDALVAWSQAGGGLPRRSCDTAERDAMSVVLVAYEIARAALLTAPDDAAHPQVRAVLYLGHRLRAEGTNALEISVGFALANAAIEWAQARGVKPGAAFTELAPADDVVFRALAAEAVCQVSMVEAGGREDQTIGTQLAAVRAFNTETVHGAFRRKDDTKAFEAYLEARAEQGRKTAETPILRTLSSATRVLIEARKDRDVYARFVTNSK